MNLYQISFESGEDSLDVREYRISERMSAPFEISIVARSPQVDLDLASFVGKQATFTVAREVSGVPVTARAWTGVCRDARVKRVDPSGLSTYAFSFVPRIWLLSQRTNHRLFQRQTIPDIVDQLLEEWQITRTWRIEREHYPKLELRVQYGESDYAFLCRLLEEAGIAFYFVHEEDQGSIVVLHDKPQSNEARKGGLPIVFVEQPKQAQAGHEEYVTAVRLGQNVRQGATLLRDMDFRHPKRPLEGRATTAVGTEGLLENYRYMPGAFLVEGTESGETPVADAQGVFRFNEDFGHALAERLQQSAREDRRLVHYATSALDLAPGVVFSMTDHPHPSLDSEQALLVTEFTLHGVVNQEEHIEGRAVFADAAYRPARTTPKPRIFGVQSAIVVGPEGEEIHTDEFGRVRVQFPWDRAQTYNEHSSCWMRVSQGWAGPGYGMVTLPRVGHEVLVEFFEGDPDSPVVVGRMFNGASPVPHKLPDNKTVSTWKSASSKGLVGFNEIRFDDAKGREHLYVQAERDFSRLVKHDATEVVGHDHSRLVQHDETITVGGDRHKVVRKNESESTGRNRSTTVGLSRTTAIGVEDVTIAGSRFTVTMVPELPAKLEAGLGAFLSKPLGPILEGSLTNTLGVIPQIPFLSSLLPEQVRGPMSTLSSTLKDPLKSLAKMGWDAAFQKAQKMPTCIDMVDQKIAFTTGRATIVLDHDNISLHAEGEVVIKAKGTLQLLSVLDDVRLTGGPNIHFNPEEVPQRVLEKGPESERAPQRSPAEAPEREKVPDSAPPKEPPADAGPQIA